MWSRLHDRWSDPPHVTSPTWGSPPPFKQALRGCYNKHKKVAVFKIEYRRYWACPQSFFKEFIIVTPIPLRKRSITPPPTPTDTPPSPTAVKRAHTTGKYPSRLTCHDQSYRRGGINVTYHFPTVSSHAHSVSSQRWRHCSLLKRLKQ